MRITALCCFISLALIAPNTTRAQTPGVITLGGSTNGPGITITGSGTLVDNVNLATTLDQGNGVPVGNPSGTSISGSAQQPVSSTGTTTTGTTIGGVPFDTLSNAGTTIADSGVTTVDNTGTAAGVGTGVSANGQLVTSANGVTSVNGTTSGVTTTGTGGTGVSGTGTGVATSTTGAQVTTSDANLQTGTGGTTGTGTGTGTTGTGTTGTGGATLGTTTLGTGVNGLTSTASAECLAVQDCVDNALPTQTQACASASTGCSTIQQEGTAISAGVLAQRSIVQRGCNRTFDSQRACQRCYNRAARQLRFRDDQALLFGLFRNAQALVRQQAAQTCSTLP